MPNGGGITLSGGECPLQEASFRPRAAFREEGIHVLVETSAHVPKEHLISSSICRMLHADGSRWMLLSIAAIRRDNQLSLTT